MNYNYAAAFTEYVRGLSIEDIATVLDIPVKTLQTHARQNGWQKLAATIATPISQALAPPKVEREIESIQANRDRNLKNVERLQADFDRILAKLDDGTLRVQKILSNGKVVEAEPTLSDRLTLANMAKTLAEMSYRALGDVPPSREKELAPLSIPTVQINLPACVSLPRYLRGKDKTPPQLTDSTKVIPVALSPVPDQSAGSSPPGSV